MCKKMFSALTSLMGGPEKQKTPAVEADPAVASNPTVLGDAVLDPIADATKRPASAFRKKKVTGASGLPGLGL